MWTLNLFSPLKKGLEEGLIEVEKGEGNPFLEKYGVL